MTSQTQQHTQQQGTSSSTVPGRSNNDSALGSATYNNGNREPCNNLLVDSFINNTMLYNSDAPIRDCNTPIAMCLLHFTKLCDGNLCFGVYCAYHQQQLTSRQFIAMTNDDKLTSRLVTVSQNPMYGRFMHLITSILPQGENLAYYESWVKDLPNIPHDERSIVAKFFCLLGNPESKCTSNTEHALLKQYLNEVAAYAFNLIRVHQNQLNNIKIPLTMSIAQRNELTKKSLWFKNVQEVETINVVYHGKEDDVNDIVTFFIPIMKFNAFDILMFMTYNLEPSLNDEGYLPNCELVHTHIVHGTNYGIYNNVESYNLTNKNFNYPAQLNSVVNQQVTARVTNLDVLSLYCVSDNLKISTYVEMPVALLKTDTCAKFNLSAIHAPELFKYR